MKSSPDISHQCPVCGTGFLARPSSEMVLSTPRGKQTWAKCPECRSFFSAEHYDQAREVAHTRTRPWGMVESGIALNDEKSPMFEAVLRALRPFAAPGASLLDIGCSYGGFLFRARVEGYHVRGVDIVPEAVEYVRSRGISCDLAGSIQSLGIPPDSLGIVSVLDCNYYWPNQRSELLAIRSALQPGGILAMRTVDTSWAVQLGLWLMKWAPKAGHRLCEKSVYDHRVSIPAGSLLRVVRQAGFEILYTSPRDAMQFRRNSLKIKVLYAVGHLAWRLTGYNLAPGFVFLARKKTS